MIIVRDMWMEGSGLRIGLLVQKWKEDSKSMSTGFVIDVPYIYELEYSRYPKQQRLLALKKTNVAEHGVPPSYLSLDSSHTALQNLKFDVILIDPPFSSSFSWTQLEALPVAALAADPSFVFLWVGSGAGEGLERGREILAKWGYRRCEDICWVRTNRECNKGPGVRYITRLGSLSVQDAYFNNVRQIHQQRPY